MQRLVAWTPDSWIELLRQQEERTRKLVSWEVWLVCSDLVWQESFVMWHAFEILLSMASQLTGYVRQVARLLSVRKRMDV
jgi:hypothetical protein